MTGLTFSQSFSSAELITLVICLILSAFFSAAETALTALRLSNAEALLDQERKRYNLKGASVPSSMRGVQLWLAEPVAVLTTILLGNNLVNILASALAGAIATRIFPEQGVGIAVGVMTLLVLVFGEITPKTLAKAHAESFAPFAMSILRPLHYLLWPVTRLLVRTTAGIAVLAGRELDADPRVSEEEVSYIIERIREHGPLSPATDALLEQIPDFDDATVREAMVPRTELETVRRDTTRDELLAAYGEKGHSRYPVLGEDIDDIVGVVYIRDLFKNRAHQAAEQAMRPPVFVSELQKVSSTLRTFQRDRNSFAVAVDEYGGTVGCIAIEDIVEELVGEILAEGEIEPIRPGESEGEWVVDGATGIDDLEDAISHELCDDENHPFDSVGGMMVSELGQLPSPGDEVELSGFRFVVDETDGKRVVTVKVSRLPSLSALSN